MKQPDARFARLLVAGLALIAFGIAASFGVRPAEALAPIGAVVAGLTALTAMSGSGPRAFL
jgi:hypothetical protein